MASSGSVDFGAAISRDNIIQSSLEDLGVMQPGDTTSSASFTDHSAGAAIKLNAIVKQLGNPTDGSPGMQTWALKRAYLFLQKGEAAYTLGPTSTNTGATNKWASSYVSTTIGADEAAGQTVLTLTDGSVLSDTNRIGIELDTGYIQWTVVSGSPAGNDVTVGNALTSAASAGNRVFGYATANQARRPLEIKTAVLRDTGGNDTPLDTMSLYGFELGISAKTQQSTPTRYLYQGTLTDGTLFFDCAVTDVTDVVRILYRSPFEDFDAAGDTIDFDPIWVRPLIHALSFELAPRFGQDARMPVFKALRDESLMIARNANPESCELYFQPGEAG